MYIGIHEYALTSVMFEANNPPSCCCGVSRLLAIAFPVALFLLFKILLLFAVGGLLVFKLFMLFKLLKFALIAWSFCDPAVPVRLVGAKPAFEFELFKFELFVFDTDFRPCSSVLAAVSFVVAAADADFSVCLAVVPFAR